MLAAANRVDGPASLSRLGVTMATANLEAGTIAPAATTGRSEETQFAWRVLILMNLFRLALSLMLFATYEFVRNPWIVGEADPELALAALLGLIGFSSIEVLLLRKRTPSASA